MIHSNLPSMQELESLNVHAVHAIHAIIRKTALEIDCEFFVWGGAGEIEEAVGAMV